MPLPAVFGGMAAAGIGAVLVRFFKWIVVAIGLYAVTLTGFAAIETFMSQWIANRFGALPAVIAQLLVLCRVPEAAAMLIAAQVTAIKAKGGRRLVFRKGASA